MDVGASWVTKALAAVALLLVVVGFTGALALLWALPNWISRG